MSRYCDKEMKQIERASTSNVHAEPFEPMTVLKPLRSSLFSLRIRSRVETV